MKSFLCLLALPILTSCGHHPGPPEQAEGSAGFMLHDPSQLTPRSQPGAGLAAMAPFARRGRTSLAHVIRAYEENPEAFDAEVKGVYNRVWISAYTESGPIIIDVGGYTNKDWPRMVGAVPLRVDFSPKPRQEGVAKWGLIVNLKEIQRVKTKGDGPPFPGKFDAEPHALAALEQEISLRQAEAVTRGSIFKIEGIQILDSKPACAHCGERLQTFARLYNVPITLVVKGLPSGPKAKEQPDQDDPHGRPKKVWMASRGTPGGELLPGAHDLRVFTIKPDGDYGSEIFTYGETLLAKGSAPSSLSHRE